MTTRRRAVDASAARDAGTASPGDKNVVMASIVTTHLDRADQPAVIDEAENRVWTAASVLAALLGEKLA